MPAVLPAARDAHAAGTRIDRVLHQLGDRLEGIGLGERNDGDRIPVVADPQLAALAAAIPHRFPGCHRCVFRPITARLNCAFICEIMQPGAGSALAYRRAANRATLMDCLPASYRKTLPLTERRVP